MYKFFYYNQIKNIWIIIIIIIYEILKYYFDINIILPSTLQI